MLMYYLQLIETEEDRQLFTGIYEAHKKQMQWVAYHILHNRDLAEDAVHTAFVGLVNNMNSVRGRSGEDVKNYVLKAAKHAAINMLKKETMQQEFLPELWEETEQDSVLEQLCAREGFEETVKAILRLKEPYSAVLYCYYVMEMDYDAIADVLQRKSATVRQQMHRGKQMLCGTCAIWKRASRTIPLRRCFCSLFSP